MTVVDIYNKFWSFCSVKRMASHKHMMYLMEWFIKIVPLQIAHSSASVDAEWIILGIFLNWNILIFSVFDANFVNIVVEFVEWMVQSKSLILQGLINVYFTLRFPLGNARRKNDEKIHWSSSYDSVIDELVRTGLISERSDDSRHISPSYLVSNEFLILISYNSQEPMLEMIFAVLVER